MNKKVFALLLIALFILTLLSSCTATPQVSKNITPTQELVLPQITQTFTPTERPAATPTYNELSGVELSTNNRTSIKDNKSNLLQALSVIPDKAGYLQFINWSIIKSDLGYEDITSATDWKVRQEFFNSVFNNYSVTNSFGITDIQNLALNWGWDSSDLEWEGFVQMDQPPGYVFKFRDGFDFMPLIKRFEDRGFAKNDYQGFSIYSHKIDSSLGWQVRPELAIANTAIIPDANILIMGPNVTKMIDALKNEEPSMALNPSVQDVADQLGDVTEGFISANPCSILRTNVIPYRSPVFQSQLLNLPSIQDYETLGVGYSYQEKKPVGSIVMHFKDPGQAEADLNSRSRLAVDGLTQSAMQKTVAETYFSLTDSKIVGDDIILKMNLSADNASGFFTMIIRQDMIFAVCP